MIVKLGNLRDRFETIDHLFVLGNGLGLVWEPLEETIRPHKTMLITMIAMFKHPTDLARSIDIRSEHFKTVRSSNRIHYRWLRCRGTERIKWLSIILIFGAINFKWSRARATRMEAFE